MYEWDPLSNCVGVALSPRAVPTGNHKLTNVLQSGEGELYDHSADPGELLNLLDDSGVATVRAKFENHLNGCPDDAGSLRAPVGTAKFEGPHTALRQA